MHARQGDYAEALALLQRGLEASLKSGDPDAIAIAYVTLATKQALSGKVQEAVANFDSCIVRSQKYGLPQRGAVAHANLAYLLTLQGDFPQAADHYQRAADMQEKMGNKDAMSVALYGLANVLESMGERMEAYQVFQRSLGLERELGMTQRAALFEGGLAMLLLEMDTAELIAAGREPAGHLPEALHLLNEAKEASKAMQHHEMTAGLELGIGSALLRMGRLPEAEAHLQNGSELYRRLGDRLGYARGQWHLGVWADSVHQDARALKHLTRAIEVADSTDNKEVAALALDARHNIWRDRGDASRALADKERAAVLTEVMHNEANTAHVTRTRLNSLFMKEQEVDSLEHARELADQERTATAELQQQRNRTWLAVGVGMLALVMGALVYSIDRRRRQERVERKTLQLEMQALRAQMNPHFLFNALASINGFIGRHDTETAKTFVARFAKLTRMVLENSRHPEVPLSNDLEALRLYMELEQVRSDNTFDFRIDVDPQLKPTDVFVPPLVLQPLVENAIWHGVANMDGRGTIVVQAALRDGRLVLSVQDDGVGRGNNPQQRSNASTGRTSLGTSITRTRLQLLAEQKGRPAELHYMDRTVGTHVELSLPI
ncbi:MAG: histidine kinase [Flavobacteriales bacterium]|nr:histidine kinase [Flavobacteriales bacterium]